MLTIPTMILLLFFYVSKTILILLMALLMLLLMAFNATFNDYVKDLFIHSLLIQLNEIF